ncbi:hypothetical protein C0Q70_21407 [Pomacea canaliculata]|uniref:EGF-like domain-containing protein n=1 Tax=Pomacea canaliculata TaxID=400727 RepID=A0A2T7NCE9_POMCA|nr:hypothetical protein C0Q70_21407 [Pomacea canaliculata]
MIPCQVLDGSGNDDRTSLFRIAPQETGESFPTPKLHGPTSTASSQSQAEELLPTALNSSQLWSHCQTKLRNSRLIENCKDRYFGTEAIVEAFLTICKVELAKDPDNYVSTPTGESVVKPEISDDVCNPICYINGRCNSGQCVCNRGFIGDNCQIKDEPPKLLGIRGSSLCDFNERPCKQVFINAENIQNKETMACKIQEILDDGSVSERASMEEAVFLTLNKLGCFLPDAGIKTDVAAQAVPDPCLHGNYQNLTDVHRSVSYVTAYPEPPLCDIDLVVGWYRFMVDAESKMPETCVDTFKKSFAKKAFSRKDAPCPAGKWSPTGFPPGCKDPYPQLTDPPRFRGPVIERNTFYFTCDLTFSGNDPDQAFEFVWLFDGVEDPKVPPEVISYPWQSGRLDGAQLAGLLNKNVGCKVRAFYKQNAIKKGPWLESAVTYWAGIQTNPSNISIRTDEDRQDVVIRIYLSVTGSVGGHAPVVVSNDCRNLICTSHWDNGRHEAATTVSVVASKTQMQSGTKDLLVSFANIVVNDPSPYHQIFQGFKIPSVQVQIRTWPCYKERADRAVTCVCGVAVREKDDVIRLYFPSSSEIKITTLGKFGGHLNLDISVPGTDYLNGRGLCGTFDNNPNNELTHRFGFVDTMPADSVPEGFTESWKNDDRTSLFRIVPPQTGESYVPKYCTCNNDGAGTVNCAYQVTYQDTYYRTANSGFTEGAWVHPQSKRSASGKAYVDSDEIHRAYDPNDYADDQVADNYTGTEAIVEAFLTICKVELAKDPDNYVTTPTGESVVKPEISDDVCNPVCYINGRCNRGQCVCNRGFIGDNCQIKDEPPKLLGIRGSNLCDFNERPCKQVFINAENIQNKETMACRIQEILDDGSVSERASMKEAVFLTLNKLGCFLPDAGIKTGK